MIYCALNGIYNKIECFMKIILNESQFKDFLKYTFLKETAKIRPWTDDDYQKVNPGQVKDADFAKIKMADDNYNKNRKKGGKEVNTGSFLFGRAHPIPQDRINRLQADITKKVQQRYKDMGNDKTIIPFKELGVIGGKKIQEFLKKKGLDLKVSGKSFSYGNSKLPENIMIVNLTSAWNCPSIAAGECALGKGCYARRGESWQANNQLRNLRMQQVYIRKLMTVKEIIQLVEAYIESAPARIKYIRISEDGDFPDQETVDFCDKLAGHLKAKYGIMTTAYTARNLDFSGVKNMIINGSNYNVKNPTRYFRAIPKKYWDKLPEGLVLEPYDSNLPERLIDTKNGTFKCHCDCRQCNFCYKTKSENGEPDDKIVTVGEIFRP